MRALTVLTHHKVVLLLAFLSTALPVAFLVLVIAGRIPAPQTAPKVNDDESDSSLAAVAAILLAVGGSTLAWAFGPRRQVRVAWALGALVGAAIALVL